MSETRRNKNQKITFWLPHFHWQVVISYEVLDVSVSFWKLWSTRAKWPSKILARPMSKISNKVELFSKKRKVFKKMVNSVFSGQTSFPPDPVLQERKKWPPFFLLENASLMGKTIFMLCLGPPKGGSPGRIELLTNKALLKWNLIYPPTFHTAADYGWVHFLPEVSRGWQKHAWSPI